MKRGVWLLVGLALGLGLGVLIGWVLLPVQYYDTAPAQLRADYRDEYVRMVALAYGVERNLERAQARLARLDSAAPTAPLVTLTERLIAQNAARSAIAPLVALTLDLGVETPVMAPYFEGNLP